MYTKHITKKINGTDSAASPVVGVMLMLVVVIIIAAVVSGFSGALVGGSGSQKAPQLTMDFSIANNGIWSGSHFSGKVTGVEKGIATKDLKIVTSWSKTMDGNPYSGGATVIAGTTNTNLNYQPCTFMTPGNWKFNSPLGYGTGVNGTSWPWQPYDPPEGVTSLGASYALAPDDSRGSARQWFGNYNLVSGTTIYAEPFGHADGPPGGQSGTAFTVGYGVGTPYSYTYGVSTVGTADFKSTDTDQMMAVLGNNWNLLRAGDTVTVKVVHVPTGKTILQKDVIVEG